MNVMTLTPESGIEYRLAPDLDLVARGAPDEDRSILVKSVYHPSNQRDPNTGHRIKDVTQAVEAVAPSSLDSESTQDRFAEQVLALYPGSSENRPAVGKGARRGLRDLSEQHADGNLFVLDNKEKQLWDATIRVEHNPLDRTNTFVVTFSSDALGSGTFGTEGVPISSHQWASDSGPVLDLPIGRGLLSREKTRRWANLRSLWSRMATETADKPIPA